MTALEAMKRPRGITVVAVLLGLLGLLGIVIGLLAVAAYALGNGDPAADPIAMREVLVVGIATLLVGTGQLVVAWALWTLRRWAWWLTIVMQGISIAEALAAMAFTEVTNVDAAVFTSLAFSVVIAGYFLT